MGLCSDCQFYTKRGTSVFDSFKNKLFGMGGCNDVGYCMLATDAYGNCRKVKGLDACHCGGYMQKNQWK